MIAAVQFLADWLLFLMMPVVAAVILLGISKKERREKFTYILIAALTALLIAKIMSLLPINQVRPFVEEGVEPIVSYIPNPGFPSDHTLLAFVMAYAAIFMSKFKKISWLLLVVAALVAIGRVLGLVHTPFDVFGGVAAASLGAVWYLVYLRRKS
ncbi:phosphatase PAP2 family protein [Candidatus Saccharibacteria bacterium]|nr:phosphatase PAP2 family protein [Candidatus Saccharibacteria bacterium]